MNLYNVLVTYSGEGAFKFYIAGVGEVEISSHRPIFLYNASVQVINDLRLLKRSLVNIKINGNPDGAYKIFDLANIKSKVDRNAGSVSQKPNIEEIKNELREEIKEEVKREVEEELKAEAEAPVKEAKEEAKEEKAEAPKKTTKKSSSSKKK